MCQNKILSVTSLLMSLLKFSLSSVVCVLCTFTYATSEERIESYNGLLTLNKDGTINVVEEITVNAEGNNIRRGIYRDFPVIYQSKQHPILVVGFDIKEISRDGNIEPYYTEWLGTYKRIYIGDKNTYLSHGIHKYILKYNTDRQIGFFKNSDEFKYNLIGTDWKFPIYSARFEINYPMGSIPISAIGVTGARGETGDNYEVYKDDGQIIYKIISPLQAYEGLTAAVTFPKFIFNPTTANQKIAFFLRDYFGVIILFGTILGIMFFLLGSLYIYGRDRRFGIIVPRFAPPKGLTPASVNFIQNMSFNASKTLTSLIISLCVKRVCELLKDISGYSVIRKIGEPADLSVEEKLVFDSIFSGSDEICLDSYNSTLKETTESLHMILSRNYEGTYFTRNNGLRIIAALLIVAGAIVLFSHPVTVIFSLYAGIALSLSFFLVITVFLFYFFISRPLLPGQKIIDEIDGFKMYLSTTEKERFQKLQPEAHTLTLFEKYLPYALALGVEHAWSQRFQSEIAEALKAGTAPTYISHWSTGGNYSVGNIVGNMASSLSTNLSSSMTAPSESSSSGGGFSSGSGGGGGGGGGW